MYGKVFTFDEVVLLFLRDMLSNASIMFKISKLNVNPMGFVE